MRPTFSFAPGSAYLSTEVIQALKTGQIDMVEVTAKTKQISEGFATYKVWVKPSKMGGRQFRFSSEEEQTRFMVYLDELQGITTPKNQ